MAEAFVKLIKRDYARVSHDSPELRGKDSELLGLVCYPERLCTQVSTVPIFHKYLDNYGDPGRGPTF